MTSGHLNGELAIVGWLEQAIGKLPSPWILGPGDDAAILRQEPGHDLVFTTDMVLENECFRLGEAGPALVGRKALAVNLSDLAAMGAKPVGCLVSLALPKDEGPGLAEELMKAILSLAGQFNCPVAGGDTNTWRGPLAVSVTAIGKIPAGKAVRRHGASPGDLLFVTGPLGGSILGHHLNFMPRLDLGAIIRESHASAMIDISDGLSLDLWRLCKASRCGAMIHAERIPISQDAHRESELHAAGLRPSTPLMHALNDGEDFELLFALPQENLAGLMSTWPASSPKPAIIGRCTNEQTMLIEYPHGLIEPLEPGGWVHQFGQK